MFCLPFLPELDRREPAQGSMGTVCVVLDSPLSDKDSWFGHGFELFDVDQFITKPAVERFDLGVLPGRAGLNVDGVRAFQSAALLKSPRDGLRAVIHPQELRCRAFGDEPFQYFMSSSEVMVRFTSMASASRVNSSTMLASLSLLRSAVSSNTKSIAQT